jgi:hypothetical protein
VQQRLAHLHEKASETSPSSSMVKKDAEVKKKMADLSAQYAGKKL